MQNLKLGSIFNTSKKRKDEIAEMLKTTPDAPEAFEKAYKAVEDADHDKDNLFAANSRQAASENRTRRFPGRIDEEQLNKLINSIVDELIEIPKGNYLTDGKALITNEDIKAVPEYLRPQLTETLCKVDIDIMQNRDDFWIIDMATADTSALSSCVPAGKLKKSSEDWLPKLEYAG